MEDVAPALIEDVIDEFHRLYDKSDKIRALLGKVKEGTATFTEAQQYSLEVSRLIGAAQESKRASGGGVSSGHGITVNQYIYSKSQTAADLMQEARYQAEMAVMLGV